MPLLPEWILEHILDQQVLPRLTHAVEEWNPLTDTVPIHTWTHPWLPLLGRCSTNLKMFKFKKKNVNIFLFCFG